MIGAIIGDVVGSRFQFQDYKSKEFALFTSACEPTDDSLMTVAVAQALLMEKGNWLVPSRLGERTVRTMRAVAAPYRDHTGWGARFFKWLFFDPRPYQSCGNGAGMRVSPVGWVAENEDEVRRISRIVTEISHDHPEGIKGAEAIAMAVYLARTGHGKDVIRQRMTAYYPSVATMTLDAIRPDYGIDEDGAWVTCQGSIPQAIVAFLEATDFEDAIRNAISIGGDADTIACMTGAIAEAYYGVPRELEQKVMTYLASDLQTVCRAFRSIKKPRIERR